MGVFTPLDVFIVVAVFAGLGFGKSSALLVALGRRSRVPTAADAAHQS